MNNHPLALSSNQMAIVRDHARMVPPLRRNAFLNDMADRLMALDPDDLDDDAVKVAAVFAVHRFVGAVP